MHERTSVRPARDRAEGRVPPRSRPTSEPAGPVADLRQTVGNQAAGAELSGGFPLDAGTRADMEAGFGRDLGQVRLHTDGAADQAVSAAGALAYTVGRHIFLGRSGLRLGNTATRHLLAHELSHVVQQERGGIQDPSAAGAASEIRADETADAVLSGRTAVDVGPGTQIGIARADAGKAEGGGGSWSVIAAIGDALGSRLLGAIGLPPGSGVAQAAMRGFAGELARQLFKDDKSAAILFLRRVSTMSAGDFAQFGKGYVSGLVEGVVSPVTDLVGLAAFGEHLQKLGGQFLVSVLARRESLGADFQKLVDKVKKLVPDWRGAWARAKADPKATVLAVLGFGDQLRAGVDAMAYSLGQSGAKALTESLAEPFQPQQQQETARPGVLGMILQPATTAVAAGRAVIDRIQNTPWAKVGGKFGYVIGSLVIQLVLLVFTEGLGNLIEQVAQKIGSLGAALGKLLSPVGKAVTRVAEFLGEVGRGVAAAEALLARLLSKVFQPLEKILGPVLKPLGEAMHELRTFLRKLFGVVEKDGVAVLEGAAAKSVPHPDIAPTPKPQPHGAPAPHGTPAPSRAAAPPGHPYRQPTPPVPEEPAFPTFEKPAKPAAPPAPGPVPDTPVTPDPAVHPPTRRRIDPRPYKEGPAEPPRRRPEFEIDPRFRKPEVPPRAPVPPEPVKAPPVPPKPPEPMPKPPEPMPKPPEPMPRRTASPGESVLAAEPPVAVPAGAEVSGHAPAPVRSPALATVGDEGAGSAAAPLAGSGERPPVRATAEGGGGGSGGGGPARTSTPSEVTDGAGRSGGAGRPPVPRADPLSHRLAALEELPVPADVRRPLEESIRRIRETAAKDPAAAGRMLDELEHVLESRGVTLPGQTLDKPTRDVLGGGRVADDEVRASAEEIEALTAGKTPYVDRFTWQVSEEEAALLQAEFPELPAAGWREQPRIIKRKGESVILGKGKGAGRTPKGATIPERYHEGSPSHPPVSLEVKNWPLDEAALAEDRFAQSDFLLKTADQAKRRAAQLPSNAQQYILIDLRGQQVDKATRDWLARRLEKMSEGALRADRVRFLTGGTE